MNKPERSKRASVQDRTQEIAKGIQKRDHTAFVGKLPSGTRARMDFFPPPPRREAVPLPLGITSNRLRLLRPGRLPISFPPPPSRVDHYPRPHGFFIFA